MKKGLQKGLILVTILTAVIGLSGCNRTPVVPTPPEPPIITDEQPETVQLVAPTISVSEDMMLEITPSNDAKTVEKTTGYEVSINGSVQTLEKTQLSLQLELGAGNDVIEVKAIGGENTESKQAAQLTITEEQKAHIAYNQATTVLNEKLAQKLSEITSNTIQNFELINLYKQDNNLVATVRYEINGSVMERDLTMQGVAQTYENIFDLNNIVNAQGFESSFLNSYSYQSFVGGNTTESIINNNYIDGSSLFAEYLSSGWMATVINDNISGISSSLGNYKGLNGYHTFNTYSTVKLEKNGETDKYIQVNYKVTVSNEYSKTDIVQLLEGGAINSDKIILDSEVVTVLEKSNIYQNAKEQFEGKQVQFNQSSTVQKLSLQSSSGASYNIVLPGDPGFQL